uniref:Uncharacterized protein n=1 Tax=viral metagenome TaxID=1070528 RepID=A0A6C0CNE4_9ZZZZ
MIKNVFSFLMELLHGIGMVFPILIYLVKLPNILIQISLILFASVPLLWYLCDNECILSKVTSDVNGDSRSFTEKYMFWLYKYLKVFLSKQSTTEEIVTLGSWLQWYISMFLIWFYLFFYIKK